MKNTFHYIRIQALVPFLRAFFVVARNVAINCRDLLQVSLYAPIAPRV